MQYIQYFFNKYYGQAHRCFSDIEWARLSIDIQYFQCGGTRVVQFARRRDCQRRVAAAIIHRLHNDEIITWIVYNYGESTTIIRVGQAAASGSVYRYHTTVTPCDPLSPNFRENWNSSTSRLTRQYCCRYTLRPGSFDARFSLAICRSRSSLPRYSVRFLAKSRTVHNV